MLHTQQQLVQAVAHEIRTPIARLRFGMEMLAMTRDTEERRLRQTALEGDLAEMEALVEELLLFSRYEAGHARVEDASGGGARLVCCWPADGSSQVKASNHAAARP